MLNKKTIELISDLYNGYSSNTKEVQDVLYKVCQVAMTGKYILILRPDNPLSENSLSSLENLGFEVEQLGFTYYIKWNNNEET